MEIPFWKMHGAANDFILVDDREQTFPAHDQAWIERISTAHTGIGAEGVILIQPSDDADFRMRFFNPDGREVEMCGNGARCVARLAHEQGIAPAEMSFDTVAGLIRAEICTDRVLLHMTEPTDWRMNQSLDLEGTEQAYHFVNSGVPHVVIEVDDVHAIDLARLGAAVRYHEAFSPAGTNVNFISATGSSALNVRTYERGVEGETPACGTGMVASAIIAGRLGRVASPVAITPASGDLVEVSFSMDGESVSDVTLLGPAEHVFRGTLTYPNGSAAT